MEQYKRSNLSYTEVVAFLKLGYQLRDTEWSNNETHIELSQITIAPVIEVHMERGRVPIPDTQKVIALVNDWEIYKIGTLNGDEASRLLALGLELGRYEWVAKFDWLKKINTAEKSTCGDTVTPKYTAEDLNASDWFVPLTKRNQNILDIEITDAMVEVYEEYVKSLDAGAVDIPKAKPTLTMSVDSNAPNPGLFGYGIKQTMDSALSFTKHPDATVKSILEDNAMHKANLKTMVISTNLIDRMLRHMVEKNITVEELAGHMKINKEALLDAIHRPNNVCVRRLVDIADAIDFDLDVIFK